MNVDTWKTVVDILLGGFITIIPGILAWVAATKAAKRSYELESKKLPAELKVSAGDAADKVSLGYDRLVEDLQCRLENVETRLMEEEKRRYEQAITIATQGKRIHFLEAGVKSLVAQLKALKEDPVFDINGKVSPEIPR